MFVTTPTPKTQTFTLETYRTKHMTMNEFADAVAAATPGTSIIYAFGDIGFSSKPDAAELVGLKELAYGHYLGGRGHLTQRRSDVDFIPRAVGKSFEYIFTVASPRSDRPAPATPAKRRIRKDPADAVV